LIQIIKFPPVELISPSLRHLWPISEESFGILRGQIHCRVFEGDLVGFLANEIGWIEITHRPKKIDVGGNG